MLSDFVEIEEFEEEAEEEEEEGKEERKKEPKKKVPLFKLQAKNSKSVSTMDRWARKINPRTGSGTLNSISK